MVYVLRIIKKKIISMWIRAYVKPILAVVLEKILLF
jgi:hypothetical protein